MMCLNIPLVSMATLYSKLLPCPGIASEEHFLSSAVKQGWGPEQFESAAVARMREAASQLVEFGVGFVGCQKVVHPVIKQLLRRKVNLVFDMYTLYTLSVLLWSKCELSVKDSVCKHHVCVLCVRVHPYSI